MLTGHMYLSISDKQTKLDQWGNIFMKLAENNAALQGELGDNIRFLRHEMKKNNDPVPTQQNRYYAPRHMCDENCPINCKRQFE